MHKIGTRFRLKVTPKFSHVEGEIVGIFAGDGSQYFDKKGYKYQVNIHFGHNAYNYAIYVKNLFENYFMKKFRIQKENHQFRVRTESKEIFYYFKNYIDYVPQSKHNTVKLKSLKFPNEFYIGFLKGFFDTDGCLSYIQKEKRWRALYSTTSKKLAHQLSTLLASININHGIYTRMSPKSNEKIVYNISIWKYSTDRFIKEIQPLKVYKQGPVV